MHPKVLIVSAPSGSGKSTLIQYLMENQAQLDQEFVFSVSATTRAPRGEEKDGIDYHFLSIEDFKSRAQNEEFVEWEEVYENVCYGTLKSEVQKAKENNQILIFDVDVVGGVNLKKIFGDEALAIFVQAPSVEVLKERLLSRATDDSATIQKRLDKAEHEMSFADKFDEVVVNENLEEAQQNFFKFTQIFLK